MTASELSYRSATPADIDLLLPLMRALQQDDPWSVLFREEEVRKVLRDLIADS